MSTYLGYFKIAFHNNTVYRVEYLLGILNTCLQIFISCTIWKVLYGGQPEVKGITYAAVATNLIIALGLSNAFSLNDFSIQQKIGDGSIAMELLKPIDLRISLLAGNLGEIIFKLLTNFIPSVIFAALFIGILPPAGVVAVIFFVISVVLGFAILWTISTIIQMTAFWIINVWSVSTIKNVIINILAGASLPLWFMPEYIKKFIQYTPFDSIYFVPVKIYMGKISDGDILFYYGKQIMWFVLLYTIGFLMWQRGKRRIVVQGG